MKISVTRKHIDAGLPMSPCGCALALAIREQWRPDAQVGVEHVVSGTLAIPLPFEARIFERNVDFRHAELVKPFEFELPTPEA
jgi:hypothetical protein